MMQTTTTRGKLKINQKNKSVTLSNEQTVLEQWWTYFHPCASPAPSPTWKCRHWSHKHLETLPTTRNGWIKKKIKIQISDTVQWTNSQVQRWTYCDPCISPSPSPTWKCRHWMQHLEFLSLNLGGNPIQTLRTTHVKMKSVVNLKKESVSPSNEQTVCNRGGRTGIHARHLPRLPLGKVGIEGTSSIKHYPPPET